MKTVLSVGVSVFFLLSACSTKPAPGSLASEGSMKAKFAIILQADTDRHEGFARALHALLYSIELKEAGHDVVLIFDGAGTGWAKKMSDPSSTLHGKYKKLKELGIVREICDYCSGAFKVKSDLKGEPLVGDYGGHPSMSRWVAQGYQLLVL